MPQVPQFVKDVAKSDFCKGFLAGSGYILGTVAMTGLVCAVGHAYEQLKLSVEMHHEDIEAAREEREPRESPISKIRYKRLAKDDSAKGEDTDK